MEKKQDPAETGNRLQCVNETCGRTFDTMESLNDHLRQCAGVILEPHNGVPTELNFVCAMCSKGFRFEQSLYKHTRKVHRNNMSSKQAELLAMRESKHKAEEEEKKQETVDDQPQHDSEPEIGKAKKEAGSPKKVEKQEKSKAIRKEAKSEKKPLRK